MLTKLIDYFSEVVQLPVEISEIVNKISEMGIQDEIYLFEADTDPTRLRGGFNQFTYRPGVYAEPRFVTHIVYSKNVDIPWQRAICAKELVHLFDSEVAKTDTETEVSQLLDRLVGPLSSEDYGLVDLQAAKDRLALYQSLPLLMPKAARDVARQALKDGTHTIDEIADWACMPRELVALVLSDEWVPLNGAMNGL